MFEPFLISIFIEKNNLPPEKNPLIVFNFAWFVFQAVNMINMEIYVPGGTMAQLLVFKSKLNVWSSNIHLIKLMKSLWVSSFVIFYIRYCIIFYSAVCYINTKVYCRKLQCPNSYEKRVTSENYWVFIRFTTQ